jgi:hypothetical protein
MSDTRLRVIHCVSAVGVRRCRSVAGEADKIAMVTDFPRGVQKRFLMKLFKSVNMELINECRIMFGVKLPSASIDERTKEFICKLLASDNSPIKLFSDTN